LKVPLGTFKSVLE